MSGERFAPPVRPSTGRRRAPMPTVRLLALLAAPWIANGAGSPGVCAEETVDFERQVAPLLASRCLDCHGEHDPRGSLSLTHEEALRRGSDSGPLISADQPDMSLLLVRLRDREMPPPESGRSLQYAEIELLARWVRQGAPWPTGRRLSAFEFTTDRRAGYDWWSLEPVMRPEVPVLTEGAISLRTPVDAFIASRWSAEGLRPAPVADRTTLLRRLKFDLCGLPPTPDEVVDFCADDSPHAYEQLVDRLLASPAYGERWARHWLDVVRFAETNGFEMNQPRPNAWPYRDYVIRAWNEDRPYDQFIREQLVGDQLGADEATGFLVGGAWDQVKSPDPLLTAQQRLEEINDMINTTGGAFLGLSLGCAKCHEHKFDPIAQYEFYGLAAIFSGVVHGERPWPRAADPSRRERLAEVDEQLAATRWEQDLHEPLADPLFSGGSAAAGEKAGSLPPWRPAVQPRRNVDRFQPIVARWVRFKITATNSGEPCLDELEVYSPEAPRENLALASTGAVASASGVFAGGQLPIHQLAHLNDGQYGNSRSWISAEMGAGWVTIELPAARVIDRVVWGRDRQGEYRDRLATSYQIEVAAAADTWQTVASSHDRQQPGGVREPPSAPSVPDAEDPDATLRKRLATRVAALERRRESLSAEPAVYAGQFQASVITHRLHRGEPLDPREEVSPGVPRAVPPAVTLSPTATEAQRRRALADWIASPENPLTARVMVNRLWHYHFGRGLVPTPSDFGWHGGHPSHPELLDWLASELVASGWSLKHIQRQIVTSHIYRLSSQVDTESLRRDSSNRYLARFSPQRLEAEALRDAVLATSGRLDLRMGGPGYDVFEPNDNYVRVYAPKSQFGPGEWRRMVYQFKPRMRQDATFGLFDCPDGGQMVPRRTSSTTALQAINLLNSPFVLEQSRCFAARVSAEAGPEPTAQVDRAFALAFGRAPHPDELSAACGLLADHGLPAFCRALFNANEFLYVY